MTLVGTTELMAAHREAILKAAVAACYLGWQESLTLLAQLVQPEIPG